MIELAQLSSVSRAGWFPMPWTKMTPIDLDASSRLRRRAARTARSRDDRRAGERPGRPASGWALAECSQRRAAHKTARSSREPRYHAAMYLDSLEFLEEEREAWAPFEALAGLTDDAAGRSGRRGARVVGPAVDGAPRRLAGGRPVGRDRAGGQRDQPDQGPLRRRLGGAWRRGDQRRGRCPLGGTAARRAAGAVRQPSRRAARLPDGRAGNALAQARQPSAASSRKRRPSTTRSTGPTWRRCSRLPEGDPAGSAGDRGGRPGRGDGRRRARRRTHLVLRGCPVRRASRGWRGGRVQARSGDCGRGRANAGYGSVAPRDRLGALQAGRARRARRRSGDRLAHLRVPPSTTNR